LNEVPFSQPAAPELLVPLLLPLAALLLLSAFISGSEAALMALNRYRLKHLAANGHKGARRAAALLDRPERLAGFALAARTLLNIFAAALATLAGLRLLGDSPLLAVAVALSLTALLLVFCDAVPKRLAARYPERIAFAVARPVRALLRVFYPLAWIADASAVRLLRATGVDPDERGEATPSQSELRALVSDAGDLVPEQHQGMLLNILDLEQMSIDDLMVPRNEMTGLDIGDSDEALLRQLSECEFARVPVYKKDIDNIVGILPLRSIGRLIEPGGKLNRRALMKEIEEPYFVPEGTALHTQLFNFQKQKRRIAIVVDEYGTVQGLIALEDILEEIVGEFTSSLATESEDIVEQTDGSYVIDGSAAIREINRALDWKLSTDGPKTLSGLLLEHLEAFPDGPVGLRIGDYFFETLDVQGNIVKYVRAYYERDAL
jgi:Mg2+/Co2+ transporter CorB